MGKFDHQFDAHIAAAKTLGLNLTYSTALEKQLEKLIDQEIRLYDAGLLEKAGEVDKGDGVFPLCHDADRTMLVFEVLAFALKHPGQSWVFAFTNSFEDLHLFADRPGASSFVTRIQNEVNRLRAIKTKK